MPEAEDSVAASRLIRRRLPPGAALLIAVLSLPGPAAAEVLEQDKGEAPAAHSQEQHVQQGEEASAHEDHHFHKHHAGLFLGGSHDGDENGFTLGGDYELRLHRLVGLGAGAEHAFGDFKESVFVFPVFLHPIGEFRVGAGPGFEYKGSGSGGEGEGGVGEISATSSEIAHGSETEFLFRVTFLYDFFIKEKFSISPNVSIDFVDGSKIIVFGVTFGVGF